MKSSMSLVLHNLDKGYRGAYEVEPKKNDLHRGSQEENSIPARHVQHLST